MKKSYQHLYVKISEMLNEDIVTSSTPWQDNEDFGQDDPYTRVFG